MVPGVIRRTTSRRIGALPVRCFRVLHLLCHRDAEAAADQASEIGFGGVVRHAAHRYRRARVLSAMGQRDVQGGGGSFRVSEEQLVEVAHAEEHQRVGMFRLGGEPLRHRRGGAVGTRDRSHGRHVACGVEMGKPRPMVRMDWAVGQRAHPRR